METKETAPYTERRTNELRFLTPNASRTWIQTVTDAQHSALDVLLKISSGKALASLVNVLNK